jgi:hypothetical protein
VESLFSSLVWVDLQNLTYFWRLFDSLLRRESNFDTRHIRWRMDSAQCSDHKEHMVKQDTFVERGTCHIRCTQRWRRIRDIDHSYSELLMLPISAHHGTAATGKSSGHSVMILSQQHKLKWLQTVKLRRIHKSVHLQNDDKKQQ